MLRAADANQFRDEIFPLCYSHNIAAENRSLDLIAFTVTLDPRRNPSLDKLDYPLFCARNLYYEAGAAEARITVILRVVWKKGVALADSISRMYRLIMQSNWANPEEPCHVADVKAVSPRCARAILRSTKENTTRVENHIRSYPETRSVRAEATNRLHPAGFGCTGDENGHCPECGKYTSRRKH